MYILVSVSTFSKTAYFTSLQNISTAVSVLLSFRTLVQQYNYLTLLQYVSTTVYLPFLQYMYVSTTVYVLFYFPRASASIVVCIKSRCDVTDKHYRPVIQFRRGQITELPSRLEIEPSWWYA